MTKDLVTQIDEENQQETIEEQKKVRCVCVVSRTEVYDAVLSCTFNFYISHTICIDVYIYIYLHK